MKRSSQKKKKTQKRNKQTVTPNKNATRLLTVNNSDGAKLLARWTIKHYHPHFETSAKNHNPFKKIQQTKQQSQLFKITTKVMFDKISW